MLFETWIRCLEQIERPSTSRDGIAHLLAELFVQATPPELEKLVNLCQGELHATSSLEDSNISVVDLLELPADSTTPTVEFIYDELVKVCQAGPGAKEQRLGNLRAYLDENSTRWIFRLVEGEWKSNVGEATILDALGLAYGDDVDVRQTLDYAYNTIANLGLVAYLFWQKGPEYLSTVRPQVGIPVKPESQTRRRPDELSAVWNSLGPCFVHIKYDGFRCQIHKDAQSVKLFIGRNLSDWTERFPGLVRAVQQQIDATSVILDSEIVAVDLSTGQILARSQFLMAQHHKAIVFDLIALDGEDWRGYPYAERHVKKVDIVRSRVSPRLVEYSKDRFVQSSAQLHEVFAECKANQEEGIIVIKPSAVYQSSYSGKRSQERLKIKSVDPVDAVIVGYELSRKPSDPQVIAFLLAVYDDQRDKFVTIGKVISGLTDDQRESLYKLCIGLEAPNSGRVEAKVAPDRWVQPSIVVELEVDYIYPSEEYTCGLYSEGIGYGSQHAKFVSGEVRKDKRPEQATTVTEFLTIRKEPGLTRRTASELNGKQVQLPLF